MKIGGHLPDETILLALDGEMSSRETTRVKAHLDACWTCRVRREQIEKVISDVVEYERNDELIGQLLPRPRDRRTAFLMQLDELVEKTARQGFWQVLASNAWRIRWQLCLGGITAAAMIFAGSLLETPPSVAASEVLRRAHAAESAETANVKRPVVYRKIRVRSGSQTATRTIYRDPATRRVSDRIEPPNPAYLQTAFTNAGFDWRDPLSASDYSAWRDRLPQKSEDVRQEGTDAVRLSTSAHDGVVQEARLTVRTSDWHPVAERITFSDSRELEITELEYRVMSLDDVDPGIFEPSVAPAHPAAPTDGAKAVRETLEPPKGPSQAEVGEAELQALIVLHNAKADVGEDLTVLRLKDEVVVQGVVDTQVRKQELAALLSKVALVQPQVQTIAEALLSQVQPRPPVSSTEPMTANASAAPPLLQQALEKQFPNVEDRSGFINQALDIAQEALVHASALQSLGTRYTPASMAVLSAQSRRDLGELLLDHRSLLRQQLLTERVLVSALMPLSESSPAVNPQPGTWQETVSFILSDVRRIHSNVAGLFAGSRGSDPSAASAVAELRIALAHVDILLKSFSEQVSAQLLDGRSAN